MRLLAFLVFVTVPAAAQTTAIVGGTIHTVSGEVIEDGTVLIDGSVIRAVGASVSIPPRAQRIEARRARASKPLHPVSRLDLEALVTAARGELPFVMRASRASDIDAALGLAEAYGLELVILGGEEAWRRSEELARTETPVIVKAYANLPLQFDRLGTRFDNAALLSKAGVPLVLSTLDTHNARNLRFEAGQAVRHGMAWEAALRAITLSPAEVMGIDDRYGSLAEGNVANVVVWSGDPFEPASAPEHIFIKGREIEHDSRQKRLLERYRSLTEGAVQYRANASP